MNTFGLEKIGIMNAKAIYRNLTPAELTEKALERGEGKLMADGALNVITAPYTGRSPHDRFLTDTEDVHNDINWGNINQPKSEEVFNKVFSKIRSYLQKRDLFVFDGFAGADPKHRIKIRVINELASQNLFMHNLLLRPTAEELENYGAPEWNLISAPMVKTIPEIDGSRCEHIILVNFKEKMILLAGTEYAGEMKKSVFYILNYLLPKKGVFPMHCSANIGKDGDTALFFGLSGTGKTTLSADPNRKLIGDDEHGWSDDGIFNFEGGCYAKCIRLSKEHEPEIYNAIRFGTLVENVVLNDDRTPDYNDDSITENTRAGYPINYIPNAAIPGIGGHPKTVIFLTADAYGVMPPVAKLSKEQAMYHFVSGFTSKLAGTERGIIDPSPTFSTCFGGPFLPMHPSVYAKLLGEKIEKHASNVYLINTGWTGGPYGVGHRISIKDTRAIVTAALNGDLEKVEYELDPIFNVSVPKSCPNVPSEILSPKNAWKDKEAYEKQAKTLAKDFVENFKKYKDMPQEIINAGPKI